MAMRRPRIKPVANITSSKRKAKSANDVKTKACENDLQEGEKVLKKGPTQDECHPNIVDNPLEVRKDSDTKLDSNNTSYKTIGTDVHKFVGTIKENEKPKDDAKDVPKTTILRTITKSQVKKNDVEETSDSDAFKCPPDVGFQRAISHASNSGIDDVFYSDIEENAMQMDLEKVSSHSCSMSPSKNLSRQRMRPTPRFGQRRNSFVGSLPSSQSTGNEDCPVLNSNGNNDSIQTIQTKRERHHSASFLSNSNTSHNYHQSPHKYLPTGVASSNAVRIRTESGCSVFSDTNPSSHKGRKIEDYKQNPRKDFESRFHNGVPEKSAIKMSDLIYYNPVSNPMEQKSNQVKLEQNDTSSNDIKPLTEKLENDIVPSTSSDDVLVPQLKLNAKGELILDDTSLVIETTAEQEARKVLANSSLIYLDEYTGMNGFYSRQKRTRDWLPEETIKFYRCLQNVGTDFSLMVSLFPNRTRRDLKLKFKKEERKNAQLINKALLYPKQFDINLLKQQIDEEEQLRDLQAKKAKIDKLSKKSEKRKDSNVISKANRVLINGYVYQNETCQNPKRVRRCHNKEKSCDTIQNEKETGKTPNDSIKVSGNGKVKLSKNKSEKPSNLNEDEIIQKNSVNDDKINKTDNIDTEWRKWVHIEMKKKEVRSIKEEIIKAESKQESNQSISTVEEYQDEQLETDLGELLVLDEVDMQYTTSYENPNALTEPSNGQCKEPFNTLLSPALHKTHTENDIETDTTIDTYESRTFVDLNDGSVDVYSTIKDNFNFMTAPTTVSPLHPTQSPSPPSPLPSSPSPIENENSLTNSTKIPELDISNNTCSSVIPDRELNEDDIQSILTELAEGSLVLVSTLDPDDPDKVLNEIYMVDRNTGNLCEEPLNIPDNIVQCILTVVS